MPYRIVEGPNNSVRVQVKEKVFAIPEISALVLKEMKAIAETALGRAGDEGRRHLPRLLQRQPAAGDQGRRADRRARGAAHHQRADRGGARLRLRQGHLAEDLRLRPGRRHLRRLDPRDRQGRLRGALDRRRHLPRRRRLRRPHHDVARRRLPREARPRPAPEQVLPPDAQGGGRARQDRGGAGRRGRHPGAGDLPVARGRGARPGPEADPGSVQPDGDGPGAAHLQGLRRGAPVGPAHRRRRRRGDPRRRSDPPPHHPQLGAPLLPEGPDDRASTRTRSWRSAPPSRGSAAQHAAPRSTARRATCSTSRRSRCGSGRSAASPRRSSRRTPRSRSRSRRPSRPAATARTGSRSACTRASRTGRRMRAPGRVRVHRVPHRLPRRGADPGHLRDRLERHRERLGHRPRDRARRPRPRSACRPASARPTSRRRSTTTSEMELARGPRAA